MTTYTRIDPVIRDRLRTRLLSSEFATEKTKVSGKYITNLRCAECGDETAYAFADEPSSINCNRKNHCGAKTLTRDLFPDVMRKVEEEHPPTEKDPDRPARIYLETRGLKQSLAGLKFRHLSYTRKGCGGGVGFPLGSLSDKGEGVLHDPAIYNARLYNPPDAGKTHNTGSLDDLYWFHTGSAYDPEKPLYITEGVINALSLIEMGFQAIAVLSSTRAPSRFKLPGFKRIILSFDNDVAGGEAFKRWEEVFPNAEAVTPDHGDWNDFLCAADSPEEARAEFDKKQNLFQGLAGLLLATTASEYAQRYYALHGNPPGLFVFNGQHYFAPRGPNKSGKVATRRVSNFNLLVDHFRLDTHNPEQPEYRYHLTVTPKGYRPVKFTVNGSELSRPDGLTATFLTHAKAHWFGGKKASVELTRLIVESKAPEVRQLDRIGYDPESDYYVFRDFAINPDGQLIIPKKNRFYEVTHRQNIRPSGLSGQLRPDPGMSARDIYRLVCAAWGPRAAVGIAFMVGAWFVGQIKDSIGFYPFLSMWGDNTAGKTYLVTAMNAMQCLDEEGIPMFKENTGKGELRKLGQISGLFRAMLEGNVGTAVRFDYGKLLPLYNKNPLQVRAVKSNDNQTIEMPFYGALVFVQNAEPFKTPAQKSRFISVEFRQEDIRDTVDAFNRVQATPKERLANFYVEIMGHRKQLEAEWLGRYKQFVQAMEGEILQPRIRQNHALILAFHSLIGEITGETIEIKPYLLQLAKAKVESCLDRASTLADVFFDALDQLPEGPRGGCLQKDEQGRIHLWLSNAMKILKEQEFPLFNLTQLQNDLRDHPACLNTRHSSRKFEHVGEGGARHVYLFDGNKLHGPADQDDLADDQATDAANDEIPF